MAFIVNGHNERKFEPGDVVRKLSSYASKDKRINVIVCRWGEDIEGKDIEHSGGTAGPYGWPHMNKPPGPDIVPYLKPDGKCGWCPEKNLMLVRKRGPRQLTFDF